MCTVQLCQHGHDASQVGEGPAAGRPPLCHRTEPSGSASRITSKHDTFSVSSESKLACSRPLMPCRVVSAEGAPRYLIKPYIHRGYLVGGTPREAAWRTLTEPNNEIGNAWTTLVALGTAVALFVYSWSAHTKEWAPFALIWLSASLHLPVSLACTCTTGVSHQTREAWRKLDVLSIFTSAVFRAAALAWLVLTSTWSFTLYLSAVLADYAYCVTSFLSVSHAGDTPRSKLVGQIAVICGAYTLPMSAKVAWDAWQLSMDTEAACLAVAAGCLAASAAVCRHHFPERAYPGRCDCFGSHAIMHVLVLVEYVAEWTFIHHCAAEGGKTMSARRIEAAGSK